MSVTASANQELLPGYVAVERLGAGGYGEVWKVIAPGDLQKAVKIIYGFLTEERATRELKALHFVKQVRHPFMLSLERIEVVDGRLMIVTELADMSLVDRYEQCRKSNLPGIPRDELLLYLRDAADALDYMLHAHSLQHLDVKPENLLLLAGRTKVADFGLVKEIADQTRSLVGAMTPTYAAPEVFEGKASRFSDQYSLGIVYQEMLTGVLPFPGRTAAQLSAQHTRNRPQLSALAPAEREIVGRALAKRPQDRFPTCKEFIDALTAALKPAPPPVAPTEKPLARPEHDTRALQQDDTRSNTAEVDPNAGRTEIVGKDRPATPARPSTVPRQQTASVRRSTAREEVPIVQVARTNRDLAPPSLAPVEHFARPTLFIGAGQTGAIVVEKLATRLDERFGTPAAREAFPLLVIETDIAVMKQSASRNFESHNILHAPLRLSHEYRDSADDLLVWLGRRWLYNIPKSLETQGMRPWGRLALVDHAAAAVSKLRPRLAALTSGAAQQALAAAVPAAAPAKPRVVIVASACGGTGGGMILELAYAVRNITRRTNAGDLEVIAVITTSTNQCPTQAQLATANTVALLTELQHYARCGAQGDRGVDSRGAIFEGTDFPLDQIYFVDLGHDQTAESLDDQLSAVADYLFCDAATPLGAALDACRAPQTDEALQVDARLRSFRLQRFDGVGPQVLSSLAQHLACEAARLWLTDVGGGKYAVERYLNTSEQQADQPLAESPDYTRRALLSATAMAWYGRQELALFPPPEKVAEQPVSNAHQAKLQAARNRLIEELLLVRGTDLRPAGSPDLAALLRRVTEQSREARVAWYVEGIAQRSLMAFAHHLADRASTGRIALQLHLLDVLEAEAAQQASKLLMELTPDAEVSSAGQIRASSRPALAHLAQRMQVRYPFGCDRRTFVLSPREWLGPAHARAIDPARQLHLCCSDAHAYICEELSEISLAQLVHLHAQRHVQILDVVEHLHTRVDIAWSEPARVEVVG